jgi:uncharacterized membrane protein
MPLLMQTSHPSSPPSLAPRLALTRAVAVGSLLALIVLGLAWELWIAPLRTGGSWLAIKVLPLCLPLAGLLRDRLYTYRWVTLMVWIYFSEGVVRGYGDRGLSSRLAMAEAALCLVLFAACVLYVRIRLGKAKT